MFFEIFYYFFYIKIALNPLFYGGFVNIRYYLY